MGTKKAAQTASSLIRRKGAQGVVVEEENRFRRMAARETPVKEDFGEYKIRYHGKEQMEERR
jgi:hypothetical protein